MINRCGDCKWFKRTMLTARTESRQWFGVCHVFPEAHKKWDDDWCGQFAEKEASDD